jgi:hypothetical protein
MRQYIYRGDSVIIVNNNNGAQVVLVLVLASLSFS